MKYQIVDQEYGPQIIPGINSMTIEAETPDEALLKALGHMGLDEGQVGWMVDMGDLEAHEINN